MQFFDAKPISPFPQRQWQNQKTGGGDGVGESAGKEIVTLSHSPLRPLLRHTPPPRHTPQGALARSWWGLGGVLQSEARPGPSRGQLRAEAARTEALLVSLGAPAAAWPSPTPRSKIRVLLGLSHTVLPVMRGGKEEGERERELPPRPPPSRARPGPGRRRRERAGGRAHPLALARPRPACSPALSFLVGSRKAQQHRDVCRASRNLC